HRPHEDEAHPSFPPATTRLCADRARPLAPRRRPVTFASGLVQKPRLREVSSISLSGPSMSNFEIRPETDGEAAILSQLSAEAFGPGRFARSAYRVREGIPPVGRLSLVAWRDGQVVGGIRFTAIRI